MFFYFILFDVISMREGECFLFFKDGILKQNFCKLNLGFLLAKTLNG